jgi:hypothetical protein
VETLDCGHVLARDEGSIGTGYGIDPETNKKICYACCGRRDEEQMMREGRITLYLSRIDDKSWKAAKILNPELREMMRYSVSNWPGTIKIEPMNVNRTRGYGWGASYPVENFWFTGPDGYLWWGRCAGNYSELAHCKRLKRQDTDHWRKFDEDVRARAA